MDLNSFQGLRTDLRAPDQLRPVMIEPGIAPSATGSCMISFGNTKVICGVTIEDKVPGWMRFQKIPGGWLTAEYSMLPYSTPDRNQRPGASPNGRSMEIQRLIGRSLRAAIDLKILGPKTVWIDCDVLQADGGTRTAAISGAWVALQDAAAVLAARGQLRGPLLTRQVAAVSVGVYRDTPVLDLDYAEDAAAATDMNVVMDAAGGLIEVQGTAEGQPFSRAQLARLLDLAATGIDAIMEAQRAALAGLPHP